MGELALVVEPHVRSRYAVEAAGFTVVAASDGEQALFEYGQHFFEIVVVDLDLPGMSCVDVCRELRRRGGTPILVSSDGGGLGWLAALDAGADDHLPAPFDPYELRARAAAVARRRRGPLSPVRTVRLGPVEVQLAHGTATLAGPAGELDPVERTLLAVFCEQPGIVVARAALAERVAARHGYCPPDALDAHIARLAAVLVAAGAPAIQRTPPDGYRVTSRPDAP